jgi:archaellin
MGISSLILFIAFIFVATISAQVLIQTATNLQSKALEVGKSSQRQISTFVSVLSISANDGSDSKIDTILTVFTGDNKANLEYRTGPCVNGSSGYETDANGRGYFTVEYIKNATNHKDGYVQSGDIVKFCFELTQSIGEDVELKTTIIPKYGIPVTTTILTPSTIYKNNVYLYP